MVRYHAMGLLTPGCGVFHLVYSCNGLVTVTLLADRDIIPDPAFYRECLEASFAETLAATRDCHHYTPSGSPAYSTVTLFARLRGLSTSQPRATAR